MLWLRWYTGTRRDPKWRALSPEGRSLFSTLLEIAKELNLSGVVHLVPGVPFTEEQLADEAAIPLSTVRPQLERMKTLCMIDERPDSIFVINFAKRQFESDNSSERVKRHREQKRQCNGDETLQKRPRNAVVTPSENREQRTETDTEREAVAEDAATTETKVKLSHLKVWLQQNCDKALSELVLDARWGRYLWEGFEIETIQLAIEDAANHGAADKPIYVFRILDRWLKEKAFTPEAARLLMEGHAAKKQSDTKTASTFTPSKGIDLDEAYGATKQ